jgi:hypothetical protein
VGVAQSEATSRNLGSACERKSASGVACHVRSWDAPPPKHHSQTRRARRSRNIPRKSKCRASGTRSLIGCTPLKRALQHTVLIDAAWLAALAKSGGVLPRCQDVPEEAKVSLSEMEAWDDEFTVGVLVIS